MNRVSRCRQQCIKSWYEGQGDGFNGMYEIGAGKRATLACLQLFHTSHYYYAVAFAACLLGWVCETSTSRMTTIPEIRCGSHTLGAS